MEHWLLGQVATLKKLYLLKEKKRFTLIPMKDLFISPEQVHGLLKASPRSLVFSKSIDRKADRDITTYRRDR